MTNNELKERLTDAVALLNIPGVGKGRYRFLVEKFGSPAAVMEASIAELEERPHISRKIATAIKTAVDLPLARRVAARIIQLGWEVLFSTDDKYPARLKQTPEAPPVLFRLGQSHADDGKALAIVGTRRPSDAGRGLTTKLAAQLAKAGISVVSGMAEGIDTAAHRGCLDASGHTIAVWGTSMDIVYPKSNKGLAAQIAKNGTIYSEYLPETGPSPAFFPERNRIIAGLSEGVIVVEAGEKSGALITAGYALEYQRELFAVPGFPGAQRSIGTNKLIKAGARLLTGVDDVFEELPRLKGQVAARRFRRLPDMTEAERQTVKLLADGPLQVDQMVRNGNFDISELMELLLVLELKGVVCELSGKRFVLADN